MIEVIDMVDNDTLGFRVNGRIDKEDVEKVFELLEKTSETVGKLKLYTEIEQFGISDLSLDALKEDIKFWFKHPGILPNFGKVSLVTDKEWVKTIFDIECALIPTLEGACFSPDQKAEAVTWLKTDQREGSRMDLTFSELVESSIFKFAGGFAVGLLTAGIFSKRQQRKVGSAILLGTIAGGLPLGLKILNNNRQLLKPFDCDKKMLGS